MSAGTPRTHLQRRLGQIIGLVLVADVAAMFAVSAVAWRYRHLIDDALPVQQQAAASYWDLTPWLIGIWVCSLILSGAYQATSFAASFDEFRGISAGTLFALLVVACIGYVVVSNESRGFPLLTYLLGGPALMLLRYGARQLVHHRRSRGRLANHVLAVGSPAAVAELADTFARSPWTGYRIVGMCSDFEVTDPPVPLLGRVADVRRVAQERQVETVLVAGGSITSGTDLRRLGWGLEGLDVDLLVVPSLTDVAGPRVRFQYLAGLPLVHVREPQIAEAGGLVKRVFDIVVSGSLLVLTSPLLVVVAAVIKLQDGGPVFYKQRRVGRDHKAFAMLKFRSMVIGAAAMKDSLTDLNEFDSVLFKIRDDPRVTRFGRILRKYSIDELPQLINVVRGDMSLVGPRPPLPDEVAKYVPDAHRRLLVRPGMTGLWQVSGRSELTWEESVRLDLYYVDNWSMLGDLGLLIKTIRAVTAGTGA